jgi:hypothetical protein
VRDDVDLHDDSLWGVGIAMLVEIARAVHDRERAAVLYTTVEPYVGRFVMGGLARASLGPLARYAGVAASLAGDPAGALRLLALSEAQCREVGARPFLARTLFDRAQVLSSRGRPGDDEAAESALVEARATAAEIGLALGDLTARPGTFA